jgi:hypothetical protein
MFDTVHEHTPPSGSSEDDVLRKELMWETREEEYIRGIASVCSEKFIRHNEYAGWYRLYYSAYGLPAAVLPLIATAAVEYVPQKYVITGLLLGAAICSAVNTFLDFGRKSQKHEDYAGRYGALVAEIDGQLCRPKIGRIACDVMLERVKERFSSLNMSAPPL